MSRKRSRKPQAKDAPSPQAPAVDDAEPVAQGVGGIVPEGVQLSSIEGEEKILSQDEAAGLSKAVTESAAQAIAGMVPPASSPLAQALATWGLREEHVLAIGGTEERPVIVTRGGRRLTWPDDAARVLTESEKDGVVRTSKHLDTTWNRSVAAAKRQRG